MVNTRLRTLRHWLLPESCLLCGGEAEADAPLCRACGGALPVLIHTCPRCAAANASAVSAPCGTCQKRPPAFDRVHALFAYAPPLDWLVHGLKYRGRLDLARFLGHRLADFTLGLATPRPDVILPVPLHVSRLRTRGYNQSLELARYVGARLGIPVDAVGVRRTRATAPQTEMPLAKRRANVRGAFQATRDFAGLRVAIVDDVMTTGSTVSALAQCLRKAGAAEIVAWVVARA
jgi:ComF family protein